MCTVVLLLRPGADWPVLIAANRDEMLDRAWDPPAAHWPDRPGIVGGRDRLAGGTWMALNSQGVMATVLNRQGSLGPRADKESRGELPLIALDFALTRLTGMMDKLVVHPERMRANLESLGGVVHSGEVLLALARSGILREDAYRIVQRNAMATWEGLGAPGAKDFRAHLDADPDIAGRIPPAVLDAAMNPAAHLREIDQIFLRVFGEPGPPAAAS